MFVDLYDFVVYSWIIVWCIDGTNFTNLIVWLVWFSCTVSSAIADFFPNLLNRHNYDAFQALSTARFRDVESIVIKSPRRNLRTRHDRHWRSLPQLNNEMFGIKKCFNRPRLNSPKSMICRLDTRTDLSIILMTQKCSIKIFIYSYNLHFCSTNQTQNLDLSNS